MALLRVLLGFANVPDHELEETAGHILTSLDGNPVHPTPPVTQANLPAALTAFTVAIAAQAQGGTAATAAKNQAAQALIALQAQSQTMPNAAGGCTGHSEWSNPVGHMSL